MTANQIQSVSGLTSITTDGSITIAAGPLGLVKIQGQDITLNGPSGTTGTDVWFGNINHLYFGAAADNNPIMPAPTGPVLGYFARQEGGLANVTMDAWSAGASSANTLSIRRARGTPFSPTAVLAGDRLGTFEFRGYTGTGGQMPGALLRVDATENFTASSHGVHFSLQTVLAGSNTLSDRLVFTSDNRAIFSGLLLLRAGAAAAGTAPLKLPSGPLNTTPESGAFEFDGTHLYFTIGSTRYQLDQQ